MGVTSVSFPEGRNAEYPREFWVFSLQINTLRNLALTLHRVIVNGSIY